MWKDLKRTISYTSFRLKIRKALGTNDREQLKIILEETKKEIERRTKQKWTIYHNGQKQLPQL